MGGRPATFYIWYTRLRILTVLSLWAQSDQRSKHECYRMLSITREDTININTVIQTEPAVVRGT